MPKVSATSGGQFSRALGGILWALASAISHIVHLKPALVCPHLLTPDRGPEQGLEGAAVIEQLFFKGGNWETGN